MDKKKWADHLNQWKLFLEERLNLSKDETERIKIKRQINTIENVRYSGVLCPKLINCFIDQNSDNIQYQNSSDTEIESFYFNLNKCQKKAVSSAVGSNEILTLVQGPPGTGKTEVIAEICLQLYKDNPKIKILVCSETHIAVNNVILRIAQKSDDIKILRIRDKDEHQDTENYSVRTLMDAYFSWLRTNCNDDSGLEIVNVIEENMGNYDDVSLEKSLALSVNVVGMTCNRVGAYRFIDSTESFDYAIVDEVCKATLPEILMPLIVSKRAVLVGDPKQLPPVFCSDDREVIKSINNCSLLDYMYIDELYKARSGVSFLNTQYRMENAIGTMISDVFYNGELINGVDRKVEDSLIWIDYKPTKEWPDGNRADGFEIRNLDEVKIIRECLEQMKMCSEKRTIGIIVPYRAQKNELQGLAKDFSQLDVEIDTVDGFQGKECGIIIFGITRTFGSSRFLADHRRLNVALSRARDRIVVVGSLDYASKNMMLKKIIDKCRIVKSYSQINR